MNIEERITELEWHIEEHEKQLTTLFDICTTLTLLLGTKVDKS